MFQPQIMSKETQKKFTLVIDPGHGGNDAGAIDNGVKEKDINLKVAKQLEALIKKKMKDTKIVMTRDDDSYLTLQQRADKANKSQGDLFISIHTNSVDKKNRNRKNIAGSSVYTLGLHKDENNLEVAMRENSVIELESDYQQKYSGFDPQRDESYIIFEMAQKKNLSQSIRFADMVEKELVSSGRQDRGVHQAGFWVLWATSMPAVLVELDFICNPESAKYISSDKGAAELAQAIFNAIEKYETSWNNRSQVSNIKIEEEGSLPVAMEAEIDEKPVAIVSTRKKRNLVTPSPENKLISESPVPIQRKRRSQAAKNLSVENNYEKENLAYPEIAYVASTDEFEDNPVELTKETDQIQSAVKESSQKRTGKNSKENKQKNSRKGKSNARVNKLVTVYKIQILESEDLLNKENSLFCGLSPISAFKENNQYKYYYGESTDKKEIEKLLPDVKKKIPDAFIVSSTKTVQSATN